MAPRKASWIDADYPSGKEAVISEAKEKSGAITDTVGNGTVYGMPLMSAAAGPGTKRGSSKNT